MRLKHYFFLLAWFGISVATLAQLKPSEAVPLMTRGINLGNTMEAPNEGAWNAPIKDYYFDDLKAAGFTTVRIPINWWNHTSKTAPYTIDAAWLNRVEQVVDWGLARGLFIVMNTHHEEELFKNFDGYLPMYVSIWTQIAERMKNKSDRLLFELLNEPHGSPTVANLNNFNTQVLKAIRKTNTTRIVVYSGNQWANSYNLIDKNLVIPDPADNYLMGYYHSYDPIGFGLSGNGTFGTDADKLAIWNKMKSVADWTVKNGIPAYVGEFGAVSSGEINSRFRYYATNVDYAITHKLPFMVWDNGGDYQVYIRGSRKFNELKDILTRYFPQSTTNFTALQQGGVVLNWINRATNATSILVQRKLTTSDAYTTLATISANATTYTDNSAVAGTYYYRVITNIGTTQQYYGYPQQITTTGSPSFAVSLSSDKTTLCATQSATLTASTIISSGTITKVDFYEGATLLASDNSAPYTYAVVAPTLGLHTYTAKATSSAGATVNSNAADITMTNGPTITPYVLINAGVWANDNNAAVCPGASVTFGPQPVVETGWTWKGPNSFTAATREINLTVASGAQAGVYTATFDDGTGCKSTMNFTVTLTNPPAPTVVTPISYALNAVATPLTAVGTNLNWYTTAVGGTASATAPTPNTSVAGTSTYYVAQTQNTCESPRAKIEVVVTAPDNNVPPAVTITAPLNNAVYTAPGLVNITATATDSNGVVTKVDFYNGNSLLGSDATAPFAFSWVNVAAGTYSITAKATDDAGAVTTSSAVLIKVNAPVNSLPTVLISAPANNAAFTAPAAIAITANAADTDGTIAKVDFYNGTVLIGSDASAPYAYSWTGVAEGTYSITAKATDNAGGTATSTAITVVVNAPVSTADLIGPDCGSNNSTLSFNLNPTLRPNVTAYNWWYTGSAASTTMVTGAPYNVTIQTGGYFSAGQVCVGVNLKVSPWYKQYCKSIAKCAGARFSAAIMDSPSAAAQTIVSPNPSSDLFEVTSANAIDRIVVVNELGNEVLLLNALKDAHFISLGDQLGAGVYTVKIMFVDGSNEVKRVVKLR